MDFRVVASLALTVLVVVAGCGAPVGTDTPGAATPTEPATPTATTADGPTSTPTPTATLPPPTTEPVPSGSSVAPWSKVTVRGGNFSFDEAQVYKRVVELHGMTLAEAPNVTVYVRDRTSIALTRIYQPSEFEAAMGITATADNTAIAGLAAGRRVYVYQEVVTSPVQREAVLAHEYAHIIQSVVYAQPRTTRNVGGVATQEGRVETGVIEGASMFVEHQYRVRYLNGTDRLSTWAAARANRSAFGAFLVAPYVFGQRYIDDEIDTVTDLDQIYDSPPQTTEQLLHNYRPDEEPARELSVSASTDGSGWSVTETRTKGELFTRLVLERQLSLDRAEEAAAGWGADQLVAFERDGAAGFAWTLRWDSASEASEFEAAFRDYLDERAEKQGGVWRDGDTAFRVVSASDETVVVLAGAPGFVEDATISGDDGEFEVDPDG